MYIEVKRQTPCPFMLIGNGNNCFFLVRNIIRYMSGSKCSHRRNNDFFFIVTSRNVSKKPIGLETIASLEVATIMAAGITIVVPSRVEVTMFLASSAKYKLVYIYAGTK